MSDLKGKKVLVTGASRGIGKGIAKRLVAEGAIVYGMARNAANLESLKKECPSIVTLCADMGDVGAVRAAVSPHLPFHYLVNNAAIALPSPFLECSPADFDSMFNINVKGPFFLCQLVAKSMVEEKVEGGSIVNVSSMTADKSIKMPGISAYAMGKAAMNRMTQSLAAELGPYGIRVNTVSPGFVPETDMGQLNIPPPLRPRMLVPVAEEMLNMDSNSYLMPNRVGDWRGSTPKSTHSLQKRAVDPILIQADVRMSHIGSRTNQGAKQVKPEDIADMVKAAVLVGSLASVNDIADSVLFFLSGNAQKITGQNLFVTNGHV